jgi:hypothetical protein
MKVQIFFGPPNFFEHKDVLCLQVPVDVATDTARFVQALLGDRFEDPQCLTTLLGWYGHPYGCLNQGFLHFVNLLEGRGGLFWVSKPSPAFLRIIDRFNPR